MIPPLLRVSGLSRWFGGLRAVDEVSFDLGSSEIVGLIGPNGAGKTTLFETISGFIRPTKGTVAFDGRPAAASSGTAGHRPDVPDRSAVSRCLGAGECHRRRGWSRSGKH
jgi:ABC-type branched-subunit amino acid transport system ATPase component